MVQMVRYLAKRVKNIDGKILGKDGKPLLPYRCVKDKVSPSVSVNDVDVVKVNRKDDCEMGCLNSALVDFVNNHGADGVPSESSNIPTIDVGSEVMGVNIPAAKEDVVDLSLADVIIPQEEVDTLSARFENSLYGYFVGQRPAFPVDGMENVLKQGPWRIRSVLLILNVWNPNSVLKKEDIKKVHVWVKMFNVPVVAYSKVGLTLIIAKLGRLLMLDAHTIPIAKMKGNRLVSIDIEFEYKPPRCSVCQIFDHVDKECHKKEKEEIRKPSMDDGFVHGKRKSKGVNQVLKVGLRLPKGKPKLIYRLVSKPTNNQVGTSKPNDSSPPISKEDVNLACEKPSVKKRMEEDKVFDINNDIVVSATISNAPAKECGNDKGSLLEQFLKSCEASKEKHHSLSDSDESEVEEVCIPDPIPGGGFLDGLEADLDGYDGYETPVYDLNKQEQSFCDQYDIRLNSRRRKSFI
ncbi:zinc knuckle CX2CX4HX4C containing protein [Tanacetum coccineum]